jgi:DNA repair exonuclease SbcCD nuclease subunit
MKRAIRFVHASDLHLDATFGGVDASDDRVAAALTRSTLEALARVVDLCIDRGADFLVIAGDLFNNADRSLRAELAFQKEMNRLADAGIGAFVAQGNHDPADGWSSGLELPDSVVVFSAEKVERHEVVRDGKVVCAVYGRSYPKRQMTENLAREYARADEDSLAVAVLHTNVGHREGWDDYAPCSVEDLRAAEMDYWALGHIHLPGRVSDEPPAVYSGCTQGLNPNEEGARGCFVVELDATGVLEEFVETASVRWKRLELDVASLSNLEEVRAALGVACEEVRSESAGKPAVVRVVLRGRSQAHADLARPGVIDDLAEAVREEQLERDAWIWVDRIRNRTQHPVDLEEILEEEGLRGDLVRLAAARSSDPEGAETLVEDVLAPATGQLVARPALAAAPEEIIESARDLCLDWLAGDLEG